MRKKDLYSILEEINTNLEEIKEQVYILKEYKDKKQQEVEGDMPITVTIGNSYYDYLKKDNIDVVRDYVLVKIAGNNYSGFFSNHSIVKSRNIDGNLIYANSKCKIEVLGNIYNKRFINWLGKNNNRITINGGLITCYASYSVSVDKKSNRKYIDDLVFIEL